MVLIKSRRPKVTRKRLLRGSVTPWIGLKRLQNIQNALAKEKCDALLLVLGPDGQFNKGSNTIVQYLFFDALTQDKPDMDKTKLDETVFEDLVLVIYPNKVSVYCNEVNYWMFLPYMACWPNVQFYCLPEAKLEDSDQQEEFKVNAFLHMLEGCSTVGIFHEDYTTRVALGSKNVTTDKTFNPMNLEKWPLIQAHAFDDFGKGRGFFTLKYSVMDLSNVLRNVLDSFDGPSVETLFDKSLPCFENVFEMCLEMIEATYDRNSSSWKVSKFEEPLTSYYKHGTLDKGAVIKWKPFVLFGEQTRGKYLELIDKGMDVTSMVNVSSDKLPTHVIIQCISPKDGLVCARSYFFKPISWTMPDTGDTQSQSASQILMAAYGDMLLAVDHAVSSLLKGGSLKKAEDAGRDHLQASAYAKSGKCEFCMSHLSDGAVIVNTRLVDISDPTTGNFVGSLVYGDTYIISILPQCLDEKCELSQAFCLTDEISRWGVWATPNLNRVKQVATEMHAAAAAVTQEDANEATGDHPVKVERSLGDIALEKCDLLLSSDTAPDRVDLLAVHALFYPHMLCIFSRRMACNFFVLESAAYYDNSSDSAAMLVLNINRSKSRFEKYISSDRVLLLCHQKSQAKKTIFSKILPEWKKSKLPVRELPLQEVCQDRVLFPLLLRMQGYILPAQDTGFALNGDAGVFTPGARRAGGENRLQRLQRRFDWHLALQHMEMSACWGFTQMLGGEKEYLNKIAQMLLGTAAGVGWTRVGVMPALGDILPPQPIKLDVVPPLDTGLSGATSWRAIVVCGNAGSYKEQLCQHLMARVREDIRWIYVSSANEPTEEDDWGPHYLNSIAEAISTFSEKTSKSAGLAAAIAHKQVRLLLCLPNNVCVQHFIAACVKSPAVLGERQVLVSSVTTCVDTRAVFLDGEKMLNPEVLETLREGWTNNIVFTDLKTDAESVSMEKMKTLVQAVNPSVSSMHIPLGEVTQSGDIETILADDTFNRNDFRRDRLLWAPLERQFHSVHGNNLVEIALELKGHLDEIKLWKALKDLKSNFTTSFHNAPLAIFADGVVSLDPSGNELTNFWCCIPSGVLRHHRVPVSGTPGQKKWIRFHVFTSRGNGCWTTDTGAALEGGIQGGKAHLRGFYKDWLLNNAAWNPPTAVPLRTVNDLTPKEKEDCKKVAKLNKLPDGWFYNGLTYVHMDGRRSDLHPTYEETVQLYVRRVNSRIQQENEKNAQIQVPPLF